MAEKLLVESLPGDDEQPLMDLDEPLKAESSGALSAVDLQEHLSTIIQHMPFYIEAHFLSYLNFLRIGDFQGALVSLDRFIDYRFTLNSGPAKALGQTNSMVRAALHSQFGFHHQALLEIQQGIPFAQACRDDACLSYMLSSLHRLTVTLGREQLPESYDTLPNEKSILDILSSRTRQLEQHHLHVVSLLAKVQWALEQGKIPTFVFHTLQTASSIVAYRGMNDLFATVELVRAGAWEVYGNRRMADSAIQQVLSTDCGNYRAEDVSLALSKRAMMVRKKMIK
eukprot:jgi/Hompol1/5392/HPOL_004375-RA